MGIMKFKLYISKSEYTKRLNLINEKLGFPSKRYSKIKNGVREHFVSDKIMTRTWAEENPRLTEQNKYAFPVSESIEEYFLGLVEYSPEWYPVKEIETKIITK